jgi:hypothetical protein
MTLFKEINEIYNTIDTKFLNNLKLFKNFLNSVGKPGIYNFPGISTRNKDGRLFTTAICISYDTNDREFFNKISFRAYKIYRPVNISLNGVTYRYDFNNGYTTGAALYITTTIGGTECSAELKNIYEVLKRLKASRGRGTALLDPQLKYEFYSKNSCIYEKIVSFQNYDLKKLSQDPDGTIIKFIQELDFKFSNDLYIADKKFNGFIDKVIKEQNNSFIHFSRKISIPLLEEYIKKNFIIIGYNIRKEGGIKDEEYGILMSLYLLKVLDYTKFKNTIQRVLNLLVFDKSVFLNFIDGTTFTERHLLDDIKLINDIGINIIDAAILNDKSHLIKGILFLYINKEDIKNHLINNNKKYRNHLSIEQLKKIYVGETLPKELDMTYTL